MDLSPFTRSVHIETGYARNRRRHRRRREKRPMYARRKNLPHRQQRRCICRVEGVLLASLAERGGQLSKRFPPFRFSSLDTYPLRFALLSNPLPWACFRSYQSVDDAVAMTTPISVFDPVSRRRRARLTRLLSSITRLSLTGPVTPHTTFFPMPPMFSRRSVDE